MKNKMFVDLSEKVGISKESIECRYQVFIEKYPQGIMTKEDFIEASDDILGKDANIAESIFDVFDEDGNGVMDFEKFLLATFRKRTSSPQAKLSWIFNVFDIDENGALDKEEVVKIIVGLFHMGGIVVEKDVLEDCVEHVL